MRRARTLLVALVVVLIALFALTPIARAMLLLHDTQHSMPSPPHIDGIQTTAVSFYTGDPDNPIPIAGWLALASPTAPTVILVAGWKQDRTEIVPYARFLLQARINTLLIDLQGSGHSGGSFSLGLHEPDDIAAAVSYLDTLTNLSNHHYGVLGIEFGAGVAIAAAGDPTRELAGQPEIRAIVADSPWASEDPTIDRLNTLHLFGLSVPLVPTARWVINQTIGGSPDQSSALQGVKHLQSGQALLLIHSAKDDNPTATANDVQQLYTTAKTTKAVVVPIWIAPQDSSHGVYAAQPTEYAAHVLAFLRKYLVQIKDPPPSQVYPGTYNPHTTH